MSGAQPDGQTGGPSTLASRWLDTLAHGTIRAGGEHKAIAEFAGDVLDYPRAGGQHMAIGYVNKAFVGPSPRGRGARRG